MPAVLMKKVLDCHMEVREKFGIGKAVFTAKKCAGPEADREVPAITDGDGLAPAVTSIVPEAGGPAEVEGEHPSVAASAPSAAAHPPPRSVIY